MEHSWEEFAGITLGDGWRNLAQADVVRRGEIGPRVPGIQPGLLWGHDKWPRMWVSQGQPIWSLGSQHVAGFVLCLLHL